MPALITRNLAALALLLCGVASADDFFDTRVEPVLRKRCLGCHNNQIRNSGFSVLGRESLLTGGNRGPTIAPGKPDESLLIRAVRQDGPLKMPPGGKLSSDEVETLAEWIRSGAPWGTKLQPPAASSRRSQHWAFAPVSKPQPPAVREQGWIRNPIDNFILSRLESEKLAHSPEVSRAALIRRVTLDLTGFLPTPQEAQQFVEDSGPDAYERLVDRLLASPHYGERWARHWLDVARYADSDGYVRDNPRPIWMYRDWVINAVNSDMPFSKFVVDQLAGDLIPNATQDQLIATGFHRNTMINLEGGIDFEQYRVEAVVDRVSTTGAAFLGLTVGCARCHDHKFDPISQREFYQLYAFFNNVPELGKELKDNEGRARPYEPLLEFGTPEQVAVRDKIRQQAAAARKELKEYEATLVERYRDWEKILTPEQIRQLTPGMLEALRTPAEQRNDFHRGALIRVFSTTDLEYKKRETAIRDLVKSEPKIPATMIMRELPQPRPAYIHLAGDFTREGIPVEPGVPSVLPSLNKSGARATRLDLANWLVDRPNPLTARVTVNRVWQQYFGKGIVATENDFGTRGEKPTHPELLDWLASEFMERGWSLKQLHRLIVTSATYRQSSYLRPELLERDPDNRLLARQSRFRLEAEIIRDASLSVSGLLAPAIGGRSVFPPMPPEAGPQIDRGMWKADTGDNRFRRGMYTHIWRATPHSVLTALDLPSATQTCTRRIRSDSPLQALHLLNDEAWYEFSQGLARRILREARGSNLDRLAHAFQLCLGRTPQPDEAATLGRFLATKLDHYQSHADEAKQVAGAAAEVVKRVGEVQTDPAQIAAWVSVSRVLLNLDEFMTRE